MVGEWGEFVVNRRSGHWVLITWRKFTGGMLRHANLFTDGMVAVKAMLVENSAVVFWLFILLVKSKIKLGLVMPR